MKRLSLALCLLLASAHPVSSQDQKTPPVKHTTAPLIHSTKGVIASPYSPEHFKFARGMTKTPRYKLASAHRFDPAGIKVPASVMMLPTQLSMWGNDQYGDCVSASEAARIAAYSVFCGLPETFIPEATLIAWASRGGYLNGANLDEVMKDRQTRGMADASGKLYVAGPYSSVDYTNEATLQAAISMGPVNVGMDANALPSAAGNNNGWFAFGGTPGSFNNEDHCMTGDTKISLLDGRELSFTELANGAAGDSFWVYSCDKDGNIVPGKAHSVRKTKKNAPIVKITLDNGEFVRCTDNHRFLLRDGTYKEAKELKVDDSLMPLYRKESKGGYELYYNPRINGKRNWRVTHRMVAFGLSCRGNGLHAHHIDLNKRNNDPANLQIVTPGEHAAIHEHLSTYNKTPEHRAKARDLMKALWSDPVWAEEQRVKLRASASNRGKRTNELGKSGFQTMDSEIRSQNGKKLKGRKRTEEAKKNIAAGIAKKMSEDPELLNSMRSRALKASQAAAKKPTTEKQREARRKNAYRLNAKKSQDANNHKIISIVPDGQEDVYDLTVDEHHNFALSSGVFAHNCIAIFGFGKTADLAAAISKAYNVTVQLPASAPASGYIFYTWSTVGIVDHAWIMSTVGETWSQNPTTIGQTPGPAPPTPPVPPVPVPPVPPAPGTVTTFTTNNVIQPGTYEISPQGTAAAIQQAQAALAAVGQGKAASSPSAPLPSPSAVNTDLEKFMDEQRKRNAAQDQINKKLEKIYEVLVGQPEKKASAEPTVDEWRNIYASAEKASSRKLTAPERLEWWRLNYPQYLNERK